MPTPIIKYNIPDLTPLPNGANLNNKFLEVADAAGKNNQVSFPTFVQETANSLPAPIKVTHLIARTYDNTDPNYIPGMSTLLTETARAKLAMWSTAFVEFPNYPASKQYRLVYDPNGPHLGYTGTDFQGQPNHAKWVEIGSAADNARSILDFNPFTASYAKDDIVKYSIGDTLKLFTAKKDLVQVNGRIPNPTGQANDANWIEVNAQGLTNIIDWLPGSYKKNNVVVYQGQIYRAKRDVILGDPSENQTDFYDSPKPTFWEAIGGSGGSGGNSLPTVDLLDLTTTQMDEVMAFSYTGGDAPLSATPAWSKPGMWFDALDSMNVSWHYYCGRGSYTPGTTGSGIGPRWSQIKKH